MYAKVVNGQLVKYPYHPLELLTDNPNTSFPSGPYSDAFLAEWNVLPVVATAPPTYDPLQQKPKEQSPMLVDGQWTQQWTLEALTTEERDAAVAALTESIVQATQARLDDFARTRQYDGILSACTYNGSPTPKFQVEGQYCLTQRDATWATLYTILAEVQAGTRPIPSGFADIEPDLPPLVWPT